MNEKIKLWIYFPRSSDAEIHRTREAVLELMAEDFAWAQDETEEGSNAGRADWACEEDYMYVDDGGRAILVEVQE